MFWLQNLFFNGGQFPAPWPSFHFGTPEGNALQRNATDLEITQRVLLVYVVSLYVGKCGEDLVGQAFHQPNKKRHWQGLTLKLQEKLHICLFLELSFASWPGKPLCIWSLESCCVMCGHVVYAISRMRSEGFSFNSGCPVFAQRCFRDRTARKRSRWGR